MRKFAILGLIAVLGGVIVAGCNDGSEGNPPPPVKSLDEQIAAIEANPDMPPQAKAAQIAQIKARHQSQPVQPEGGAPK